MSTPLFYEELGKLLYAIAMADERIDDGERESISRLITERLLHREKDTDRYGTNEAWITRFSFETAEDSGVGAAEAMDNFIDFTKAYQQELTEHEFDLCIKLANSVADTFHHINKKENSMLTQLRLLLLELKNKGSNP